MASRPQQDAMTVPGDAPRSGMQAGTRSTPRRRRGRLLAQKIRAAAAELGRPLRILDIGGRAEYWDNVGFDGIGSIVVLNNDEADLTPEITTSTTGSLFSYVQGDARELTNIPDGAFDMAHSNSVIEHVGGWGDMSAMAAEAMRVGQRGWVQTPAWEFPLEPHFRVPFMHWFGAPIRRRMLWFSGSYRGQSAIMRRGHVNRINLLSRKEVSLLFPNCPVFVERVALLPKSYVVTWGTERMTGGDNVIFDDRFGMPDRAAGNVVEG